MERPDFDYTIAKPKQRVSRPSAREAIFSAITIITVVSILAITVMQSDHIKEQNNIISGMSEKTSKSERDVLTLVENMRMLQDQAAKTKDQSSEIKRLSARITSLEE